jgi:hypothetical protein
MDTNTLLIVLLVLLVFGGGGLIGAAGTVAVNDFHLVSAVGTPLSADRPVTHQRNSIMARPVGYRKVVVARASTPKTSRSIGKNDQGRELPRAPMFRRAVLRRARKAFGGTRDARAISLPMIESLKTLLSRPRWLLSGAGPENFN